ncbi:MAG TPA: alpha/beta hydrolase [Mycobacterium sp.]|nr:alpha/beta hydrolase [Mycobacterium sp.]
MIALERFSIVGPVGRISGLRRTCGEPTAPVVFVHHINGAAEQWSGVIDALPGRSSVAVDLRGHGHSESGGTYGAGDYAADVAAAMAGLGIPRAHLVGASFGGGVCVTLAAVEPARVESVVVVGGALRAADPANADAAVADLHRLGPIAFFEMAAEMSFAPDTEAELLSDAVRLAAHRDIGTVENVIRAAFSADVSAAAERVSVPALVLTGEYDQTCPPGHGAALATALGAECRVLPGRGHLAHIEDPVLIARLLDEQLRRTEPLGGTPVG